MQKGHIFRTMLLAFLFVSVFYLLSVILPSTGRPTGSVNYAPDGYSLTIKQGIADIVTSTRQEGLFYVSFKGGNKLPFSADQTRYPDNRKIVYPSGFIEAGDSIFKNPGSDTFFVFRKNKQGWYILPH